MTVIEVPGEQTFSRVWNIPPVHVRLPCALRSRFGWVHLSSAITWVMLSPITLILPVFALGAASWCWLAAGRAPSAEDVPLSSGFWAGLVAMCAMLALGVAQSAMLVSHLLDVLRPGPTLELTDAGLIDHRSSDDVLPWSEVAEARFVFTQAGITSVLLKLRHGRPGRWNPFRAGVLGLRWRRRADELWVPVVGLTQSNHTIAHAIAALVERAGGTVDTRPPGLAVSNTGRPKSAGSPG